MESETLQFDEAAARRRNRVRAEEMLAAFTDREGRIPPALLPRALQEIRGYSRLSSAEIQAMLRPLICEGGELA